MKILIIGANGYLGSAITTALARAGHEVVRAGRARGDEEGDADFRAADLTVPASLVSAVTPDIEPWCMPAHPSATGPPTGMRSPLCCLSCVDASDGSST